MCTNVFIAMHVNAVEIPSLKGKIASMASLKFALSGSFQIRYLCTLAFRRTLNAKRYISKQFQIVLSKFISRADIVIGGRRSETTCIQTEIDIKTDLKPSVIFHK